VGIDSFGLADSLLCSLAGFCTWQDVLGDLYHNQRAGQWNAKGVLDDSCEAWHEANAPETLVLCSDTSHVIEHHVQTPLVVRMGLRDDLIGENFVDREVTVPSRGDARLTIDLFAELTSERLRALRDVADTAEEADAIGYVPATFGPPCAKHETLQSGPDVYDVRVEVDGAPVAFMDVIASFRDGAVTPIEAVFIPGTGQGFSCP
jgi:hypothetical protein